MKEVEAGRSFRDRKGTEIICDPLYFAGMLMSL